jgi:hypothetical protein
MSISFPSEDSSTNVIIALLSGAAFICAFDMVVLIAGIFRSWQGLYFWSLVTATGGQILCLISLFLQLWVYNTTKTWIPLFFGVPGYIIYVPGQLAILWSRLHLLMASDRMRKFLLLAAVGEFFIFEIPMTVLYIMAVLSTNPVVQKMHNLWWQMESIAYLTLDVIFVGAYNFQMRRIWPIDQAMSHQRRTLRHIVIMTFFIVFVDVAYIIACYRADPNVALALEVSILCKEAFGID